MSPSRAGDFKQCPLLYRLRAVDRIPEVSTEAQVKGTVVHAALEALYALPAQDRVPATARELVDPAWERVVARSPDIESLVPADERPAFLDRARALVAGYYELEDPTRFEPESCEQRVEVVLDDGTPLRGFIDRIDVAPNGMIRVVDYKTGRAPREFTESKALFQMKFYALMIMRMRGVVPAQLKLMYLSDKQELTYTPDEGELRRFERMLSAIWKAILAAGETGDFRAKRGALCKWCDHQALCPEFGGTPPAYPGWPTAAAEPAGAEL
ncbi:RecB family exonuclease [Rhodococcus sp. IEGM 1401]|uniref:RecB family exonuclease n=1 Tax=Rhodococcus sp. IEGM 1372 TaxID=3047087 RepID=UPI0022B58218|nr:MULTISPECIES: RecB family exonuclease [unclassified Rhodococcus (in: high G+C Gram-positive bacteria)]MCZ4560293.1 RecB family exonuclease [Rhodococcus sp. IEGM 1401]MDI6626852.1 RecB family exonuclease [Rhodococcus sp. (in: high G+C Gram-positive bacteria)]MDI9920420.1 RecB family exonuclease [Rhodococcus sp. IEGM 1372]MDV8032894.1 RecB family exonuclease [Rhodococcus sp. IEGM 1414]